MTLGVFQITTSAMVNQASRLNAIGYNIANVNTVGFKRTDVGFKTLASASFSNAGANFGAAAALTSQNDIGGIRSAQFNRIDVQGQLYLSRGTLDVAIVGRGFFAVQSDFPGVGQSITTADNPAIRYTRNGDFQIAVAPGIVDDTASLDGGATTITVDQGFLADSFGNYVLGVPVNPDGQTFSIGPLRPLRLDQFAFANTGVATTEASLKINIPSSDPAGTVNTFGAEVVDASLNPQTVTFNFITGARPNEADLTVPPPPGATTATVNGANGAVINSIGQLEFTSRPAQGSSVVINGITYRFDRDGTVTETLTGANPVVRVDTSANNTVSQDVRALLDEIIQHDPAFDTTNARASNSITASNVLTFTEDGTGAITVDGSGLLNDNGASAVNQTTAFTVSQVSGAFSDVSRFTFTRTPAASDTVTINDITYTFSTSETADRDGGNTIISLASGNLSEIIADLEAAVEGQDLHYAQGAGTVRSVETATAGTTATGNNDTLELTALASGAFNVSSTDGLLSGPAAVDAQAALIFANTGGIQTSNIESVTFNNPGGTVSQTFTLDLSETSQFAGEFAPGLFTQNGLESAVLADIDIDQYGVVSGTFSDNSRRALYKIPLATFANPNGLLTSNGPLFQVTEDSGAPQFEFINVNGVARIHPESLEGSNVDLSKELTDLIVAQQAYNSASTAFSVQDELLEEAANMT